MRRLRIAVGGFMHETNTFIDKPTTWEDFARDGAWPGYTAGPALLERFQGLNLAISGFVAKAQAAGHEIIPLSWAGAMPGGRVAADVFRRMTGEFVSGVQQHKPDVVFLELHGAMVADGVDHAESRIVAEVRRAVGPDIPIVGSLDLHGNIAGDFVAATNLVFSYRTYPHIDWGRTGERTAEWLERALAWGPAVARAWRQTPFLVPVTTGCTFVEPSKGLYETLEAIEAETGVALSLNMGFPPADVRDVGPTILAYGADQRTVDAAADRLLAAVMAAEPAFAAHQPMPAADAVREALTISRGGASKPVILADTQDNPGAGAPSNTTGVIAELLAQRVDDALVGNFHDPQAAAEAHAAGIGSTLTSLGGRGEGPGQTAIPGPWRVVALSDGRFAGSGPMLRSKSATMGPSAVLQKDNVRVLVITVRQQPVHQEAFSHIGHDPKSARILVVKSSAHFRSGFQGIAEKVIVTLSPGTNPEDPAAFDYERIRPGVRVRPRAGV